MPYLFETGLGEGSVSNPTLRTSYMAEVRVEPDTMKLIAEFAMRDADLELATQQLQEKAASVIALLQSTPDVQVTRNRVQNSREYSRSMFAADFDRKELDAAKHLVAMHIDIVLTNLEHSTRLFEALVRHGAVSIYNVSFILRNKKASEALAINLATKGALGELEALAAAAGGRIGRIISLTKQSSYMSQYESQPETYMQRIVDDSYRPTFNRSGDVVGAEKPGTSVTMRFPIETKLVLLKADVTAVASFVRTNSDGGGGGGVGLKRRAEDAAAADDE